MLVLDMITDVANAVPKAEARDLMRLYNDALQNVWGLFPWKHKLKTYTFTPRQQYTNGTVSNGSTTTGASDGTFEAAMVGAELSIVAGDVSADAQKYTVASVTSATAIEMTEAWALAGQTGGVVMTVTQRDWPVPSDFLRVSELEKEINGYGILAGHDYELVHRDGAQVLHFHCLVGAGVKYRLVYYRKAALATGPESEVDAADGSALQRLLWLGFEGKMIQRWSPANEMDLAEKQGRAAENRTLYAEAIQLAQIEDKVAGRERRRNLPVALSKAPGGVRSGWERHH